MIYAFLCVRFIPKYLIFFIVYYIKDLIVFSHYLLLLYKILLTLCLDFIFSILTKIFYKFYEFV